jgi:hypothetical protein
MAVTPISPGLLKERAVRKDIGLDALEDAEAAAERRVEAVDLSLLSLDFLDRETAGVMRLFE